MPFTPAISFAIHVRPIKWMPLGAIPGAMPLELPTLTRHSPARAWAQHRGYVTGELAPAYNTSRQPADYVAPQPVAGVMWLWRTASTTVWLRFAPRCGFRITVLPTITTTVWRQTVVIGWRVPSNHSVAPIRGAQ